MKTPFAAALAALLAAAATAARAAAPAEVEFTSLPEGANVVVDGRLRGITPLKAFDIELDAPHHLRIEMKDHEPWDEFFTVGPGSRTVLHAELKPVKGLLLVTTEPAGAEVSLDGYSLGETPRLITALDAKNEHRMMLRKPGYQDRRLFVRFNGRNPVVQHVNLVLDSGVVAVTSEPAGAEVTLNGIPRGVTPATVSGIPKGRVSVTLKKDGYETETRELAVNAGDEQSLFVTLRELSGGLRLTSVPDGARFYVDDEAQGRGPVTISVRAGEHRVRAELDGFGTVEKTLAVERGKTLAEEFRLENVLGTLEVRTSPPGATVFVDGRHCGITRSDDPKAETSDVIVVAGLEAGEHTLIVKRSGYAESVRHPVVENLKTTSVRVPLRRVFKPNVRIVTATGAIEGVLVSSDAVNVFVEYPMGITQSIPRDVIRTMELIEEEEEVR